MRIGEAAAAAGMTTKALRYYEGRGLLPAPVRNANGYREYTQATINRLHFIRRGRAAALSLTQIREILRLRDAGETPCTHVQDLLSRELSDLDDQIAELVSLRDTVAEFQRNAERADPDSCDPAQICSFI
ncbi:heavy metal-responsive transcriptional regulator [Mycetocola sp. CAN_C7]|uniref:heavy metal-responsive transcriptional regulator n=1 Tax=Mycetocola sp. CAN_C7 TaxID=2787724 RepID=UPI0018C8F1C1